MDILSNRPNVLFFIWVRNKQFNFIFNHKLNKHIYYRKLINALTTKETGNGFGGAFITWKVKGKNHRDDGPAYIIGISKESPNGTLQIYFKHGMYHRDDGPSWINGISKENPNGKFLKYFINDKRHREDGPAGIFNISKENPNGTEHTYYKHGVLIDSLYFFLKLISFF